MNPSSGASGPGSKKQKSSSQKTANESTSRSSTSNIRFRAMPASHFMAKIELRAPETNAKTGREDLVFGGNSTNDGFVSNRDSALKTAATQKKRSFSEMAGESPRPTQQKPDHSFKPEPKSELQASLARGAPEKQAEADERARQEERRERLEMVREGEFGWRIGERGWEKKKDGLWLKKRDP